MALIKLSAGSDQYWLLNDVPHQRGQFDISAKIGSEVVEIYSLTTLKSLARGKFSDFSPDGITPYVSTQTLIDDLKAFFFRSLGSSSGGVTSVNGDTGVVILDADDIDDLTTNNKFVTSPQLNKIDRLNNTNTQVSTTILAPNITTYDLEIITAQSTSLVLAVPIGTSLDGQKLIIRIKDNGTAQGIVFNAIYRAIGITLPTTTTVSKVLYIGCIYNSNNNTWDILAIKEEV